jgi:hypothetical protein
MEQNKEKPSSKNTSSQSLFKVERKVDVKPYQGDNNVIKLNQWLKKLEVYLNFPNIGEDQNISFARPMFESHAQNWWEIHKDS